MQPQPAPEFFAVAIAPVSRDRAGLLAVLARMKELARHRYLEVEVERHIPAALLRSSRVAGRIRVDARVNAIFPHADQEGP